MANATTAYGGALVNMTKMKLVNSLLTGQGLGCETRDGRTFCIIVRMIEAEDGSGHSFNVRAHDGRTFYVRTLD
jgi:hypothetical protein